MINEGERKHHYQDLLNYITIIWLRLTFETNFNFVFETFKNYYYTIIKSGSRESRLNQSTSLSSLQYI